MAQTAKSELKSQVQPPEAAQSQSIIGEAQVQGALENEASALSSPRLSGRWVVRLACGLLLVAVLWRHEQAADGPQSLARAWKLVSWPVLPLAVAWYWFGQVISAYKWRLLLRAQGIAVSLRECCRWYAVGMFWNLWMPTNIGGDAVRVMLAAPRCGGRAVAASSVLIERLTGFLALLAIGAVALIVDAIRFNNQSNGLRASASGALASGATNKVSPGSGAQSGQEAQLLGAALGVLLCLVLLWLLVGFVLRRLEKRAPENGFVQRLALVRRALESYGKHEMRRTLAWAMLLSLCFQASQIVLNIGLARVVGLDVRSGVFWWLVPLLALASLLPVGIGGLGVREAAAAALLAGSGAATQTIVLWSLLWQATVWIASVPGIFWRSSPHDDAPNNDEVGESGTERAT